MTPRGNASPPPEKHCTVCGRRMEWRKKWARSWDQVKYCSDGCRRRGRTGPHRALGQALEEAVVELLASRARDATICPSEAARRVAHDRGPGNRGARGTGGGGARGRGDPGQGWRGLMEPAREAGRRLAAREVVVFRQGGRPVDPSTAKGPVRIGRGPRWRDR